MAPPVPSLSPRARDMPVPRNHSCILARVPSPLLLGARSWEAARSRVPKGRAGQAAGCRQVNTTRGWGQRWGARPPDQLQQLRPPGPCYDARVHPGMASKWASQEAGVPCGPHRGGPPRKPLPRPSTAAVCGALSDARTGGSGDSGRPASSCCQVHSGVRDPKGQGGCQACGPPLEEGGRAGPARGASPGRDPRRSSAPHRGPLSCCSRATGGGHGLP